MENFKQKLYEEAKKINIELSDEKLEKFQKYKDLLLEWNERVNLTAITDEYQIIMKHFIDCLETIKYVEKCQKIIDIGTGAGFPGIVLAICLDNEITLVDALEKRIIFLNEVINKLDLKNVKVVHSRAEELSRKDEYRQKYDIATARAVSKFNNLLEFNVPFLKVGGRALLLKSNSVNEEIFNSKNALNVLNCKISNKYEYNYKINEEQYDRFIIEIIKLKDTPSKYPRNYGKIKKSPL